MKLFVTLLVGLATLQPPSRPAAQPLDLERGYRANNRGVALLEQFNYDAAAAAFREALQVTPEIDIARVNLSIALFYGGKAQEAAEAAGAAVGRLPTSPTSHYVAGLIAKGDNQLEAAAAAFERVLQLDPADAGAKVQLGQVRTQERRYADAVQLFQDALAAEPFNVTAAYNLALALTRAGRADEGRQAMQRFESLRSSAYGVTYAQTYLAQGRYAEALTSSGLEGPLVNPANPAVTFRDVSQEILPGGATASAAAAASGGVTLFDVDGDGHLDILEVNGAAVRLLRKNGRVFTDITASSRLTNVTLDAGAGAVAGDYDNDGKPDLLLFGARGLTLLHQEADHTFADVTSASALPRATSSPASAAFADVDHDGDLDIVTAGTAVQMLRNNGNGSFTDITADAGLSADPGRAFAIAPADFDNRRDIDLIVAGATRGAVLYRNMRDGTFRDTSTDAALPQAAGFSSLAVGDVNKDGYPDLFFGRRGPGVLALSDGRGKFKAVAVPGEDDATVAAQFVDYDNDGLMDLFTLAERRGRVFRNIGGSGWSEATTAAALDALAGGGTAAFQAFQSMALGDLDADGDVDVVIREASGRLRAWRNDGGDRNKSATVHLTGRVSNRSALGAKVELRAGSLRQTLETSSASPAIAPADLIFGLGFRPAPDAVRVLWPSGILQAETPAAAGASTIPITELDRKPSSCPYLYTWNGTRFEFVTDFMGGGEMGDWIAPSTWNQPDPDEYVRIRGDQLRPRNGRYELRVTNELEEALFVDRLQLVAVDHPANAEVYPNEGLRQPPRQPFGLTSVVGARPPRHAFDEHGHDVLDRITSRDRRYADDFDVLPIRGYAAPHVLTIDPGITGENIVLLLTGWTDYAFSNDNVAASQRRLETAPPSLQVKDAAGTWTTAIADVGFPVGRPQTIALSLAGKFLSGSREIRILTNMRIYWDQILVASADPARPARRPRLTRLDPTAADLRWRGFSAETTPDGREPFDYDYDRVSTAMPWKTFVGRYTREGDVRPLLRRVDDMFAISRPGDEIALSFDAHALPPLPAGWTRTFLLHAHGYSKEMNPRSASPDTVGPLPFRAMTRYPYGPDEHYPDTPAYRDYLSRYNTRVISRPLPSIDAGLPLR